MSDRMTTSIGWRKALSTNATATGFTTVIPTTTKPATVTTAGSERAVIDLNDQGLGVAPPTHLVPDLLILQPFGTNAANEDYHMRVWGWHTTTGETTNIWVPSLLAELVVTLGNIDGSAFAANTFMADTISINAGSTTLNHVSSPESDLGALAYVDMMGAKLIEIQWDCDAGSVAAANANALWRTLA